MRILQVLAVVSSLVLWAQSSQAGGPLGEIANFTAVGNTPTIQWTPNPGDLYRGTFGSIMAAPVSFNFVSHPGQEMLDPAGLGLLPALSALGSLDALMTMTTNCCEQQFSAAPVANNVTFTFTYSGLSPLLFNGQTYGTGTILLRSSGNRYFPVNGGGFQNGDYYSDLIYLGSLTPGYNYGSVSFLDLSYPIGTPYPHVDPFTTQITTGRFFGGVPDPSTWALMVSGFGMVGLSLRRRRLLGRN